MNEYNIDLSKGLFIKPHIAEAPLQIIKNGLSACNIDPSTIQKYDGNKIKQESVFVDVDESNFSVPAIRIMNVSKIVKPSGNLVLTDIVTIDENGKQ